jgi:protein-arginine kinase activator protein McsA
MGRHSGVLFRPIDWCESLDKESYQRLKWHIRNAIRMETERELASVKEQKNKVVRHTKYEETADLRDLERLLERRVAMLR